MPTIARLYLLCDRVYRRISALVKRTLLVVKSIHAGLWLGVLPRTVLHEIDQWTYDTRLDYHISGEHNTRGLFSWEDSAVQRHFVGCQHLLVTPAGGGREVLALRRLGFAADGFECNPLLAKHANELLERCGFPGNIRTAPRDWVPPAEAGYDGVIVGWISYTHVKGRDRRIELLRQLRSRCCIGSPILLSYYRRRGVGLAFRATRMAASLPTTLLRRQAVELGDVLDPNFQHYFTDYEIRTELDAGGFRCLDIGFDGCGWAVGAAADTGHRSAG